MTNNKKNTILKTKDLSIGYTSKKGNTVVASAVNLELKTGELVGLIGVNGIGKSTLLRTLTKVQKPLDGQVFIHSEALGNISSNQLAQQLSVVLTEHPASKNLSVFELVALGRQPYTNWVGKLLTSDLEKITQALEQTNLTDLQHKKCFELSDGQLQKVMIARALAQDTDLIILDEPTTHLDLYHKAYVLKLLQKLVKTTQKTILFSSHEVGLALQLCDRLIVMTKEKTLSGTPKALIEQGVLGELFPKDLIAFDENSRTFRVK